MRIGIFSDTYVPEVNGVAYYVERLKREYEKRGHTVYLFVPNQDMRYRSEDNGRTWFLPSFRFYGDKRSRVALPLLLPDQMKHIDLDVIHTQTPAGIGLLGIWMAGKKKIPAIHTYHTLFEEYAHYLRLPEVLTKPLIRSILKIFLERHGMITVPSEAIRNLLRKQGIARPIEIVPSGIDIEHVEKTGQKVDPIDVLSKLGLRPDSKFVITTSRLDREKNIDFLLRAFKRAKAEIPDLKFVIVGKGTAREFLENESRNLGIDNDAVFAGFLSYEEMFALYKKAEAFVFASVTETQGYVVLEALSLGLPAIVVDAMGTRDTLALGGGFLVRSGDEENFARRIVQMSKDTDLQQEKRREALDRARELSLENMVEKLLSLYDSL